VVRGTKMSYEDMRVNGGVDYEMYTSVFETASEICEEIAEVSKRLPKEKFYLADLACRHSKLVCVNLQDAWRIKEQRKAFLDKLSEAAQAASKTQNVLELASKNNYIDGEIFERIDAGYENMFEEIFSLLCAGKKFLGHTGDNGKRSSAERQIAAVA
jgi:four helix bundle protein